MNQKNKKEKVEDKVLVLVNAKVQFDQLKKNQIKIKKWIRLLNNS